MKKIKQMFSWNPRSIIYKNFIIIALVVALPFCLLCSGLFMLVYINTADNEYANNYTTGYNIISVLDNFYSETKKMTIALAENETAKAFITSREPKQLYRDVEELITTNFMANDYIDSIYLYSSLNRYVISNNFTGKIDSFYDKGWLAAEVDNQETVLIQVRDKYETYPHLISFIVSLQERVDVNNHVVDASGKVVVNVDVDKLCRQLFGIPKEQTGVYVFNQLGNPIFYNEGAFIQKNTIYTQYKNDQTSKEKEKDFFILEMASNGYHYVYAKPKVTSRIFIGGLFFLMLFLFVLITFVVSYILAKKTFKPIGHIVESMMPPSEDEKGSMDEVQYIIDNINKHVENKQLLDIECEQRMQLLNKVYMSALQIQINPHFIYNSLETINFMAYDVYDGENDISKIAAILSKLLRFSLNTEQKFTDVETEFQYLMEYVQILKIRFPEKCKYTFLMEPNVRKRMIPKLILQPIVENAFMHGVQLCEKQGEISVTAAERNGKVIITVTNTGKTLDYQKLQFIKEKLEYNISLRSKHIGISNVQCRIKMLVGEEYGITDVLADADKTTFVIELPIIEKE